MMMAPSRNSRAKMVQMATSKILLPLMMVTVANDLGCDTFVEVVRRKVRGDFEKFVVEKVARGL